MFWKQVLEAGVVLCSVSAFHVSWAAYRRALYSVVVSMAHAAQHVEVSPDDGQESVLGAGTSDSKHCVRCVVYIVCTLRISFARVVMVSWCCNHQTNPYCSIVVVEPPGMLDFWPRSGFGQGPCTLQHAWKPSLAAHLHHGMMQVFAVTYPTRSPGFG